MKRKIIECDICHKDITTDNRRYKFKQYENEYFNFELPEFSKWNKLDMCEECFKKLQQFVIEERNSPITTKEEFDSVVKKNKETFEVKRGK